MPAIEFNTSEYVFSHAKNPRGFGMWAFALIGCRGRKVMFTTAMNYGDAKKQAREAARKVRAHLIVVLP